MDVGDIAVTVYRIATETLGDLDEIEQQFLLGIVNSLDMDEING